MTYETAQQHAIKFLLTFTRSDFDDIADYSRFKAYRYRHHKKTLPKGGYERILAYLGYAKIERWEQPAPVSDKLIDILTDDA